MKEMERMSEADIHAFGIEIVCGQLEQAEWVIESADVFADRTTQPQIVAHKDGEIGFFVVRTDVYPNRGRIEGEEVFQTLVRHAIAHGANCYFASVGIANADGKTESEMSVPLKGAPYHVTFDGLLKMELPEEVRV